MANPKNPLIGSFRDPAPGEGPPGKEKEKKPAEQGKPDTKAAGPASPAKPEEKPPADKGKTDPKAAGPASPAKPEEKPPADKGKADTKATGPASPPKPAEKKSADKGKADIKATAPASPSKPEEKPPADKGKTDPKATGPASPSKPEEKPPAEPGKAAPKVAGPASPAKPEEKPPADKGKEDPKAAGSASPPKSGEKPPADKGKADPKAAAPASPSKPEEKPPADKGKTDPKAAGPASPAKPEEKLTADKGKTDPKAAGPASPSKPEEKPPAAQGKAGVEQSVEQVRTPNLRFVKIADISPLPGTYVKDIPREDYSDLIDSIKKNGVNPIILRQGEKGGYQLVDGFHRCEALKQAGMLEIRADVYEMTLADASRYRKDHRKFPKLPLPGRLIPYHPEPPAPAEKGTEASGTPEEPLPENLKIPLAPVDQPETVTRLKIADIRPFEGHPFNVKDDKDMWDLVDSVKKFGVLEPAMVIPHKDGGYEMVSGHRRMRACQLAGLETMPIIIRNLDRDEAIISMVDANLKREIISPMEKARAYQMKTDAMRRKVGRRSKAEILSGEKPLNADQELAQQIGESVATVQRFKTLNKLTPELQDMVDEGKIPVNTGVDIAQMKPEEQRVLADAIKREDKVPTGAKVKELKEASRQGTLTEEKINNVVAPTKREINPELKVTFTDEELRSYFPDKSTTVGEVKRVVFEALAVRQRALERKAREAAEKGGKTKSPTPTR